MDQQIKSAWAEWEITELLGEIAKTTIPRADDKKLRERIQQLR